METPGKAVRVPTRKEYSLGARRFTPAKESGKILVISSATGVLQSFYGRFAAYMAELGFTVFTFDYRGIGESGSDPSQLRETGLDLRSWGSNDQAAMIRYAKSEMPNNELIVLTHSIGGQLFGFNPEFENVDKLVMVASQSGYWKYFKGIHLPKMWLFWNVLIPLATPLYGYFPAKKLGLFENLPREMVYQWARWGKKPAYMMHYHEDETYFFRDFTGPLLSLSFPEDIFAPKAAVDWLTNQYASASVTRVHYKPKGLGQPRHFGFFRQRFQEELWNFTHRWICNTEPNGTTSLFTGR